MIFNKIEILYDKLYLALKIKYSEIRKPTFMEFLILLIIIEYPNKRKTLSEILKQDFNILNQTVFEKALRDLINFKVIEVNKIRLSVDLLNMNIPINNFKIKEQIEQKFKTGDYTISQDNKTQDFKYFFDPITKEIEVLKEINWDKRITDLKFSHKINIPVEYSQIKNKNLISSKLSELVKQDQNLFGENCVLKNISIDDELIENIRAFEEYIKTENVAIEASIEIFNNGAFKIKTDNNFFNNYLRLNSEISLEILKDVLNKYDEKLKKIFVPEISFKDKHKFISSPELLSNLNVKTNYNLLLINDQFIKSDTEIIKNKDFTKNIQIIIFYNSKRNTKVTDIVDDKLIFYVDYIDNEVLQSNSFIYLDSQNLMNGFLVANKLVEIINLNIPVFFLYKNPTDPLNLVSLFKSNIKNALEKFEHSLLNSNYKTSMSIYIILERLSLEREVIAILEKFLLDTVNSGSNYIEMRNYLLESENRKLSLTLEKIAKDLIIDISKNKSDEEMFEIIKNYEFKDSKNILDIFNKIDVENNIENIYKMNHYLQENSIDGWKFNVKNSLIVLTNYFKNNNRAEMFNDNKYNSDVWIQHANTLNLIGKLTKELYMSNYQFVEDNYSRLLTSLIDLVKNSLDIKKLDTYLINLSESLVDFYKTYYKYKITELQTLLNTSINYKVQLIAGKYINNIEQALNKFLDKSIYNMPIELKLEWVKNIENKSDEVEKILKDDEQTYKIALNIIFGKKREYTEDDLIKYTTLFGG
ncbi:hypothetical protein [Spiroplasma floricola]|uniref:Uncharacterized protein n=1 Tax=Spiroplasma floricola 23-6 TaxID=1336749 RepID=A0A2K8SCK3_9MOLU|nr:hypothetical protein [Spiroplasma floricola]AUB31201.1 hypothetical protein SFLOR_v1c01400 [Spiroplasma floricola 23-6]